MARIPMPHDRESAEHILGRFMDNAFSVNYESNFKAAVDILHGPFFIIQRDSSKRMYFRCTLCNKDMNSIRAVSDHSLSGTHNKNKDLESDKIFTPRSSQNYHPSTLQYKVSKTDPSISIIGLQMIEAYDQGWNHLYYKCILCGAHGKVDPMYKHLIGNKHTDKYIKSRIFLKSATISAEEREALRKRMYSKENYTECDIKTIKGREYYPYKWEDEGKKWKFKWQSRDEAESPVPSPSPLDTKPNIAATKAIKRELEDSASGSDEEQTRFRNPSPQSFEEKKVPVVKYDKKIQAYSSGFLESVLQKFNVIVQAHLIKETDLHSPEDLRVALNILRYALHLFYAVFDEGDSKKKVVSTCLGFLMIKLIPYFETKYGQI